LPAVIMGGSSDADAVAAATEAQLARMAAQSQALERFAPEILRSFLQGASWTEAMDGFFSQHCGTFAAFELGSEYSMAMSDIHRQFVATAEGLLDRQLAQMSITADRFLELTLADLASSTPDSPSGQAAQAVMELLDECADFERFGEMMRRRHDELCALAPPPGEAGGAGAVDVGPAAAAGAAAATSARVAGADHGEVEGHVAEQQRIQAAAERRRRARAAALRAAGLGGGESLTHVRVLWDIENMPPPAGVDPFGVVKALHICLEAQLGYGDAGVDILVRGPPPPPSSLLCCSAATAAATVGAHWQPPPPPPRQAGKEVTGAGGWGGASFGTMARPC
jgi:hypothetical protein